MVEQQRQVVPDIDVIGADQQHIPQPLLRFLVSADVHQVQSFVETSFNTRRPVAFEDPLIAGELFHFEHVIP